MDIPKNLWSKWTNLYSRGDADKVAELAQCHPNTVLNAIRNGRTNPEVFDALAKFYTDREALIQKHTA